jgi:hypothetical protein
MVAQSGLSKWKGLLFALFSDCLAEIFPSGNVCRLKRKPRGSSAPHNAA